MYLLQLDDMNSLLIRPVGCYPLLIMKSLCNNDTPVPLVPGKNMTARHLCQAMLLQV
jgi:hypothetical protein